jgi:hypothetical protein
MRQFYLERLHVVAGQAAALAAIGVKGGVKQPLSHCVSSGFHCATGNFKFKYRQLVNYSLALIDGVIEIKQVPKLCCAEVIF